MLLGNYFLIAFLLLFGLVGLISLGIPMWAVYVTALIAGVLMLVGK